jgi:hypothetical protein
MHVEWFERVRGPVPELSVVPTAGGASRCRPLVRRDGLRRCLPHCAGRVRAAVSGAVGPSAGRSAVFEGDLNCCPPSPALPRHERGESCGHGQGSGGGARRCGVPPGEAAGTARRSVWGDRSVAPVRWSQQAGTAGPLDRDTPSVQGAHDPACPQPGNRRPTIRCERWASLFTTFLTLAATPSRYRSPPMRETLERPLHDRTVRPTCALLWDGRIRHKHIAHMMVIRRRSVRDNRRCSKGKAVTER